MSFVCDYVRMARALFGLLAVWLLLAHGVACADEVSVIVSSRQYQEVGPSTIHLYLYGLDGRLKKQLTNAPGLDDEQPAFNFDGTTVLFTRTASNPKLQRNAGRYTLELATGKLTRLREGVTDNWGYSDYVPQISLEGLGNLPDSIWAADVQDGTGARSITALNSAFQLISMPNAADLQYPGQDYSIRFGPEPAAVPIVQIPGFMPASQVDHYESFLAVNASPFLVGPSFAAMFLRHHLNSTDGEQIWGLDLHARKWTLMSGNGGSLYHGPNGAGVFFVDDSRYETLGKSGLSVNCAYLEWWDAHLNRTRLAPPQSVFYGAAIHFDQGSNAVIREIWGS
jgi:hypothetical protein